MTVITEVNRLDDLLKWEMENHFSREKVTVLSGQVLLGNEVVSKATLVIPTTGTLGSGTKGTCTAVTGGTKTQIGIYKATCTTANEAAVDGIWRIEAPDGTVLGDLVVTAGEAGTGAFTDPQINLTVNYATDDSTIGDYFNIAVTAGTGKVVELDYTKVDGTQISVGFVIADYDASAADKKGVAVVRDAQIVESGFIWPIVFTSGGTTEIKVGDTITGATTTTSSAVVRKITLSSGTWAGGDAAGTMLVDHLTGDLTAENIKLSGGTNDATVAATATVAALAILKTLGIVVREEA